MYKSKTFLFFGLMLCGVNIHADVTNPPTPDTTETHASTVSVKKTTSNVKNTTTEEVGVSTSSVKISAGDSSKIDEQKSVSEEEISSEISSVEPGSSVDQAVSSSESVSDAELNSGVEQAVSSSTEPVSDAGLNSGVDQAVSSSTEPVSDAELNTGVDQAASSSTEPVSDAELNTGVDQAVSSSTEPVSDAELNTGVDQAVSSSTEPVPDAELNTGVDQTVSSRTEPVSDTELNSGVNQEVFKSGSISVTESNDGAKSTAPDLNSAMIIMLIVFVLLVEVINFIKTRKLLKNSNNLLELCNTYKDSINKYQELFQNFLMNQENDLQKIISLYTFAKENESSPLSDADISEQHEIVKIVADRLSFMKVTMSKMDPNIKGFKQLNKSIIQITNNLQATGYEIIDYLGEDYKEGMKVVATFITDENLEEGKRIITGVIKPQINYKGTMIQSAQITVSQN